MNRLIFVMASAQKPSKDKSDTPLTWILEIGLQRAGLRLSWSYVIQVPSLDTRPMVLTRGLRSVPALAGDVNRTFGYRSHGVRAAQLFK